MSNLWFTRASLKRDAPDVAPLIQTLLPRGNEGKLANAPHRLLWTLLDEELQGAGKPQRPDASKRDKSAFLWRPAERENAWYVLGPKPRDDSAFFEVETKPYRLTLDIGDMLSFDLAVNATINRMIDPAKGPRQGRQRCDIVMDAMKAEELATGEKDRPKRRDDLAEKAIAQWLETQGDKHGFSLDKGALTLASYQTVTLHRSTPLRSHKPVLLGVCSVKGHLRITDPALFAAKVEVGFGHSKAFGLGLMLLRRIS